MKTALFDYDLPRHFIAQYPADRRDHSRLLVLHRSTGAIEHRVFANLPEYVGPGDVLVVNNTRVIRARLYGTRSSGGGVELLLVRRARQGHSAAEDVWEAMVQCRGRLRDGEQISVSSDLSATLLGRDERGVTRVALRCSGDLDGVLDRIGRAPLPPYIKRPKHDDPDAERDAERYQTVYAREPGAVAAPTAGLHFTPELLAAVRAKGCVRTDVTLHVGPGTFRPVRAKQVEDHRVDAEYYTVSDEAARTVGRAERVIAVGTTSCRVLETVGRAGKGTVTAAEGWAELFIYPPFEFRVVDCLVTNFHLPKSSLLMLVSAFAGRERILAAYEEAKREGYRFYSYGDAMLIL